MSQNIPELSLTRNAQLFNEELIFEKSRPGRVGFSLPENDSDLPLSLDPSLIRDENELRLPEVSEGEVLRHFTRLSTWNYGIDLNFYPLGSCTMKYNPRINEEIASLPHYSTLHPDLPGEYSQHALEAIHTLQDLLCKLTDMKGVTLQPAAGAHGELTGLFLVQAYMKRKGEKRDVILVPDSAHGTNPATCTLAGYRVRQLKSTDEGLLDLDALRENLKPDVAALMITNPNTLGVFEKNIRLIADLLHENGSLLYMDGANYNAIIGVCSLGEMGVDISHLNLHKTFSTPHGGGGPGAAAVVVSEPLREFLPGPLVRKTDSGAYEWFSPVHSIGRMKSGPGHTGILLRSLSYILTYGSGIAQVAENSVLNANLVRRRLEDVFQMASTNATMHEAVFSDLMQKKTGLATLDLAKTLIDYGYHPPTVYFPLNVSGAMMVEPTETESPEAIEHFVKVMREIANRMNDGDESMKESPRRAFSRRVDEVNAARNPVLNYFTKSS